MKHIYSAITTRSLTSYRFLLLLWIALHRWTVYGESTNFCSRGNETPRPAFYRVALPRPTGRYSVGYLESVVIDRTRVDALNPRPDQPRRLPIGFWYPAVPTTAPKRRYVTDVREAVVLNSSGNGDQLGVGAFIETNGANDAPVAKGCFPVLLFSPGYSSLFENYQVFAEQLASYGYVVIGVNHPGISAGLLVDGELYTAPGDFPVEKSDALNKVVIADLQSVFNQIRDGRAFPSLALGSSLDLGRVGVFGHSFGASAALRWAGTTSGIRAAAGLDGTIWGDDYLQGLNTQALMIRTSFSASVDTSMEAAWSRLKKRSLLVTMPMTVHVTYGDFYWLNKVVFGPATDAPDAGFGVNPSENVVYTRNLLVTYFNVTLKGAPAAELNNFLRNPSSRAYVSDFRFNR
jgi:dienelactone hydrolase